MINLSSYGLIGKSLSHSRSVSVHRKLGLSDYSLFELEEKDVGPFLRKTPFKGLNVTIPYKKTVMEFCDIIDKTASLTGCANTLVKDDSGRITAYNTDVSGFDYAASRAGISLSGRNVTVIGSGGASLAVQAALRGHNPSSVNVVSRNGRKELSVPDFPASTEILINCTPVGMYPNVDEIPVSLSLFPSLCGVIDLIYNPVKTGLILEAEALGIPCSDGLPMLVSQGAMSEFFFTGKSIPHSIIENVISSEYKDSLNIALIGMPGSGKSAIGRILTGMTGRELIDTDSEIEKAEGRSIQSIFESESEEYFRKAESRIIKKAGLSGGKIIVTGGGAVTVPENYESLRRNSIIYEISRPLELIATDGRPLMKNKTPADIYGERKELYGYFADKRIVNDSSVSDAAEKIRRDFFEDTCY